MCLGEDPVDAGILHFIVVFERQLGLLEQCGCELPHFLRTVVNIR